MGVKRKTFSNHTYNALYEVEESQSGMRLDQFSQLYLESFSPEYIKDKIKKGEITIIDRPGKIRPSMKLLHKDLVDIYIYRTSHEDEYWRGEKLKLIEIPEISFEDDNIIVINKPPYMATHPTGRHIFNCATVYFESRDHGKTRHSVHRIDRETSGLLILAKNPRAAIPLTKAFEDESVKKCYFFIAKSQEGFQDENNFIEEARLGASENGLKRVYIDHWPVNSSTGKHAKTFFSILHREKGYALGLAFPQTGRQHQIRVHAMIHALPLIGDKLYLGSFEMFQRFKDNIATSADHDLMELPRHALHAISINIPYQGNRRTFTGELPPDLRDWIEKNLDIALPSLREMISKKITSYFKDIL